MYNLFRATGGLSNVPHQCTLACFCSVLDVCEAIFPDPAATCAGYVIPMRPGSASTTFCITPPGGAVLQVSSTANTLLTNVVFNIDGSLMSFSQVEYRTDALGNLAIFTGLSADNADGVYFSACGPLFVRTAGVTTTLLTGGFGLFDFAQTGAAGATGSRDSCPRGALACLWQRLFRDQAASDRYYQGRRYSREGYSRFVRSGVVLVFIFVVVVMSATCK